MRNAFMFVFTALSIEVPPSAGWFVVAIAATVLAWWWRGSVRLQRAAVMFSIAGGVLASATFLVAAVGAEHPGRASDVGSASTVGRTVGAGSIDGPNVYYIILDGYTGGRALKDALAFDNTPFMQGMISRGFRDVSREYSNYLRTVQTLGGIFSLDYPVTEDPRTWKDPGRLYARQFDADGAPNLISRLQARGYATWFSASLVAGCPARHVRCIGSTVAVDGVYMVQAFLTPTPFGRVLVKLVNARRNAIEPVGRHLGDLLSQHQPMFIFAHHLAPHPPFSLDRNCNSRHPGREFLDAWRAMDRDGYIEGLLCVNSQVERFVDSVVSADPGALIVLQSDHGSGLLMDWDSPMSSWTQVSVQERASYLNLVRSPPECEQWLDRQLGQINTARFVIACAEGRPPEYLDERTYISTYALGREQDVVREWRPPGQEQTR
ncbi:MAG TPA: sulfatase-like hydrolase/transferase [Steroidobacteraceae bacterium]|nr:sulfatase-like hydrolase/transferase [Steroidobacteraceae bacterium]